MEHRWAVTAATGAFLYGGTEPYECADGLASGQIRVVLPRPPNTQTEKYSGNPAAPFVAKTAQEIADAIVATADTAAAQVYDTAKLVKAKGISDLAFRLGKAPGALTPGDIAAERTRILNIYKAL